MNRTISIADDSPSIRDLVGFTLQNAGYQVIAGVDGKDALKHCTGIDIDLVITDLHMPEMDGISLIKEIRSISTYQFTPILLLTTESQAAKKEEAKAAGATGWIVKPFDQQKLLDVVKRIIRS